MSTRRLITISLPPALLRKAERVAREENRTKSELLREALRLYVETTAVRRTATRERLFGLIDRVQARTVRTPRPEIRRIVRQAMEATRRERHRSTA